MFLFANGNTSIINNRIVEEWWQHDVLGLMEQLEGVPAVAKGGV